MNPQFAMTLLLQVCEGLIDYNGCLQYEPYTALTFLQRSYSASKIMPNPHNHHTVIDSLAVHGCSVSVLSIGLFLYQRLRSHDAGNAVSA